MNILISGATGFIGKATTSYFISKGHRVFSVLRNTSSCQNLDSRIISFIQNDDIASLTQYFEQNHIEGIIHLAGYYVTEHNNSDIDKLLDANIRFGCKLLEASVQARTSWFLNMSTFWETGFDDTYRPVNLYAATKRAFIDISKYYTEKYPLKFCTLKICDTYGIGDTRKKIINLWRQANSPEKTLKMSEGNQLIDILYIDDVVHGIYKLSEMLANTNNHDITSCFKLSSNQLISLKELAKLYEEVSKKRLYIEWGAKPYRDREVMSPHCPCPLLPGWEALTPLTTGLKLVTQG